MNEKKHQEQQTLKNKVKFKRIVLYARQHRANPGVNETLCRLIDFLEQQEVQVYQDIDTASGFDVNIPILAREDMGKKNDLIIVIGGDGSLLSAARMAIKVDTPVIGINRGRLGFLTDILPHELEKQLDAVLRGDYEEEKRFLLHTRIYDKDHTYFEGDALNDVVLGRGNETHLIEFSVLVNQQLVSHYRSDGMILSTPTGSTAYALSAGGPIMHPQLNAIVLVPMFSHSLSSRPLVIDAEAKIELHISHFNEADLRVSCDGHESRMVKPGQKVAIQKNGNQLRLLHPLDYHYYDTLRSKLGWESKHQG
ncbi:NAD(+) kinase [Fluoribacter gormanii]|uniref:NAD kinase n=1 Tax=Fluoribacter gormanii TaxID=464 RepID=A0A377GF34_9GAMM|nr:NAD(+) kinase [Fluoribacter gormanii]KTD04589.1 inorganic polyphosphate/ATP-NAD kinase [Fluoribacter gormanii]MCW8445028.1 NAD(+) kinase [Fluoribacter gormanii]MCW8470238.1 NAD(+) kinase [Fluoribacter gormanii]SIR32693.1 NAD+ kinase [Fluoribacter gormanii]STO23406.1 Probable inorganic polyphosphate/ATP-NAD kinase [Fluoribacter gormanii]